MNALIKTSISVLLTASAAGVFAAPPLDRGAYQGAAEPRYRNQFADRSDVQPEARVIPEEASRSSNRSGWQDEKSVQEIQVDNWSERGRRPGRMSPEERRALRRQINEAGHDIYLSKP